MIYFDNSATALPKPPAVAEAVAYGVDHFGNAGRSFYEAALLANREIYNTRAEIAKLIGLDDPLQVAFTSSATESLNLVIGGLVRKEDHVITTVTEHNSVLRPLYLSGCALDYIGCDSLGNLLPGSPEKLLQPPAGFLICSHGSNVTGNIIDAKALHSLCKSRQITMILDISQTFGAVPVDSGMADIFCFTGHKGLFGPQGTGGVITNGRFDFRIVKSGGAGVNSFDRFQSPDMPDIFETGTPNSPGIYGLQQGVRFVNETGLERIMDKEKRLWRMFYEGVKDLERVILYGDFSAENRLPVLSLNVEGLDASELAERLWEGYGIATRAGSHCAPLTHKHFGTIHQGMARFSFSYFNTEEEIERGVTGLREIIRSLG